VVTKDDELGENKKVLGKIGKTGPTSPFWNSRLDKKVIFYKKTTSVMKNFGEKNHKKKAFWPGKKEINK
jgi:hypothetical protein